jgi:hypothetical protein
MSILAKILESINQRNQETRAFELFLQGKQSVEVAIELDIPADQVEELHVQYWRLSKLDDLEILYHETEYTLSLLLRLHNILKDKRITKDKDISFNRTCKRRFTKC